MLTIFLATLAILVLSFSTITDLKKREVPDWISYFFIISALGARLLYALFFKESAIFWYGLIGFGLMFLFGYLMYIAKQWGGGDAKLLMGLGAAFATFPDYQPLIFLVLLLINILFFGAIYGIIYGGILAARHWQPFKEHFLRAFFSKKLWKMRIVYSLSSLFLVFFMFFLVDKLFQIFFLLFAFFLFFYPYFLMVMTAIEHTCMFKKMLSTQVTEGDWIAKNIFVNGKYVCGPSEVGITKEQIHFLIRHHVKIVIVREGMPFVPPFLLGLLFTLFAGHLFSFWF